MGKRLVIKGADFSYSNIDIPSEKDILYGAGEKFYTRLALAMAWGNTLKVDTRCCVSMYKIDTHYNRIKVKFKQDVEYVFGIGSESSGQFYARNEEPAEFAWVTDSDYVIAPIDTINSYLCINMRYSDERTMPTTIRIEDVIEKMVLFNK